MTFKGMILFNEFNVNGNNKRRLQSLIGSD
jgi:hypothetical protein